MRSQKKLGGRCWEGEACTGEAARLQAGSLGSFRG